MQLLNKIILTSCCLLVAACDDDDDKTSSNNAPVNVQPAGEKPAVVDPMPEEQEPPIVIPEELVWQSCYEGGDFPFECTTLYVPMNHQDPSDEKQVAIAMLRIPSTQPEFKRGSLFFHPGGPGPSGIELFKAGATEVVPDILRAHYDIIAFDQRGIGRSDQLECFKEESDYEVLITTGYPLTTGDIVTWKASDEAYSALCAQNSSELIHHMSTADAARDMDLMRQAVGDEELNYFGASYGSFLGETYVNIFPENVGLVVLDGIIDPIAWTTGYGDDAETLPLWNRTNSAMGAQDTLNEFFRLCDEGGAEQCTFAGNAEQRFWAIHQRLKEQPLEMMLPDQTTTVLQFHAFLFQIDLALRDITLWPELANQLAGIEMNIMFETITNTPVSLGLSMNFGHEPPVLPQHGVSAFAIICADTDNPAYYDMWELAINADIERGYFSAQQWGWGISTCHSWTGSQDSRYTGPFNKQTNKPVLLVTSTFDPASPYQAALAAHELMPNSHLLTVEGWGHGVLGMSSCGDNAIISYLVTGILPDENLACQQDLVPFGGSYPSTL
ncbi:MAG: alpha/beta fold hydrolase [Pseudomonadales bacterium]|nr:alpha/beta fold hydrolase [Pseudomonadales bacterium]